MSGLFAWFLSIPVSIFLLLFKPALFFRQRREQFLEGKGLVPLALAVAAITTWINGFFHQHWMEYYQGYFFMRWEDAQLIFEEVFLPGQHWTAGPWWEKIKSLVHIFFVNFMTSGSEVLVGLLVLFVRQAWGAVIYMAAFQVLARSHSKNLRPDQGIRWKTFYSLVCFALAPSLFAIIPIFGDTLGYVCSIAIMTVGLREVYGTSTWRSFVVVISPLLLVISIVAVLGLFVLFGVLSIVTWFGR